MTSGSVPIAVVTGANRGLGYQVALEMAKKGIEVVLGCRDFDRAEEAKSKIIIAAPHSKVSVLNIDLAKLSSVRAAAKRFRCGYPQLNVLINNAAIMAPPYSKTQDGFELQMATNFFGHFLFTSLLLDIMPDNSSSRVTWLSSNAHKLIQINFDDIHSEGKYNKWLAYGQSKLANLMLALELDRRLKKAGLSIRSNCAHPGSVQTQIHSSWNKHLRLLMDYTINPFFTHSLQDAAAPILEAALSAEAKGGVYYGPTGLMEMTGSPGLARIDRRALDGEAALRLWRLATKLTGAEFSRL